MNAVDFNLNCVLHGLCACPVPFDQQTFLLGVLEMLVVHLRVDVNSINSVGDTPLHFAVRFVLFAHLTIYSLVVGLKMLSQTQSSSSLSLLLFGLYIFLLTSLRLFVHRQGNPVLVHKLLQLGADTECPNHAMTTPRYVTHN